MWTARQEMERLLSGNHESQWLGQTCPPLYCMIVCYLEMMHESVHKKINSFNMAISGSSSQQQRHSLPFFRSVLSGHSASPQWHQKAHNVLSGRPLSRQHMSTYKTGWYHVQPAGPWLKRSLTTTIWWAICSSLYLFDLSFGVMEYISTAVQMTFNRINNNRYRLIWNTYRDTFFSHIAQPYSHYIWSIISLSLYQTLFFYLWSCQPGNRSEAQW